MIKYLNSNGDSNVKCNKIHDNYIDIIFNNRPLIYRYSYTIPGVSVVNELKRLVIQGYGLNGDINRQVEKNMNAAFLYIDNKRRNNYG